mgnify:CR=1 FL=1
MNFADILPVFGGAALGLIVAYVNMRISKANMNASNMAAVMGVNMLRLLLDAAALAACYFVCKAYELPMMATLIAAAVGLSAGGMLFLRIMVKKAQPQGKKNADGGE